MYWLHESERDSRSVVSDSLRPPELYSPWNSLCQNTAVGNLSLPQRILPSQGSNPGLPQVDSLPAEPQPVKLDSSRITFGHLDIFLKVRCVQLKPDI